jgi:hypothetical protein
MRREHASNFDSRRRNRRLGRLVSGAGAIALLCLAFVRPAFAPPWPRCLPCQVAVTTRHFDGYFPASETTSLRSISWISIWTDTQGVSPAIYAPMAGTSNYMGVYDQYLTAPFNSAMVSFWGCYDDGFSARICGWTDWQSVVKM